MSENRKLVKVRKEEGWVVQQSKAKQSKAKQGIIKPSQVKSRDDRQSRAEQTDRQTDRNAVQCSAHIRTNAIINIVLLSLNFDCIFCDSIACECEFEYAYAFEFVMCENNVRLRVKLGLVSDYYLLLLLLLLSLLLLTMT